MNLTETYRAKVGDNHVTIANGTNVDVMIGQADGQPFHAIFVCKLTACDYVLSPSLMLMFRRA